MGVLFFFFICPDSASATWRNAHRRENEYVDSHIHFVQHSLIYLPCCQYDLQALSVIMPDIHG
ncbi:hypothetical protein CG431_17540 [Pantoea ananatis]|nr:hypothetical protein B9Q16_22680 [Pantoea ananatis]OWY75637.1 hypothetical protein CDN97_17735 [Pantoea sp. AMG 501]PQK83635.1 hypothetical protein CG431_17540 [Pantoea ananatis]PQK86595.1 hypothetical protein CG432_15940 [Pantoea ananatis]PQK91362.1 hypothetical protein CG433_16850 [Pantoea ananatis]